MLIFGIDYKLVWEAIKIEIPKLKPQLQDILRELEEKIEIKCNCIIFD